MLENIRSDLRRYVKAEKDYPSKAAYMLQFLPVIFFHEGAMSLIAYRFSAFLCRRNLKVAAYIVSKVAFFLTGNYIHHETKIGPGCKITHSAVVIHAASIGKGFECSANVTIGQQVPYKSPYPTIGDYAMIGAGARVLNNLGDEVIVGANAVVTKPVPGGQKVAGIPAKYIGDSQKDIAYYKSMVDCLLSSQ